MRLIPFPMLQTPEECAARGLPVGSRVIGPVSRATAPMVAQAPVQQYVTVQPTQVRPQAMRQQYVQQQYVQPQYVQPQYVQHRQAAVPAQPAAPVKGPVAQASVGASFTRRSDNMYYCDAVTPGSSAEAAGMRVGYMLEKINRARVAGQAPERVRKPGNRAHAEHLRLTMARLPSIASTS